MAKLFFVFLLIAVLTGSALGNIDALMRAITGGFGGRATVDIPISVRPPPLSNVYSVYTPLNGYYGYYGR